MRQLPVSQTLHHTSNVGYLKPTIRFVLSSMISKQMDQHRVCDRMWQSLAWSISFEIMEERINLIVISQSRSHVDLPTVHLTVPPPAFHRQAIKKKTGLSDIRPATPFRYPRVSHVYLVINSDTGMMFGSNARRWGIWHKWPEYPTNQNWAVR